MSLAENLLNSLDETAYQNSRMAVAKPEEEHIIVGQDRAITVPNKLKTIAVTGDKDIETVAIDCIRYWDGHDLSSFAVYINYRLPNGETGTYIPQNITKNDDHFTFEWVIGREITQYRGKISFLILARQVDDSGNLLYQWSSLLNDECAISQGLDITNITEEELSQDVVTQILQNLNSKLSYSNISKELGYSEGTVLSQKTTTIELNRRANALKGTVSGSVVAMKDVSPLEHELDVKVSRKNLIPYPYAETTKTENGITFTDNGDGTITANGTPTNNAVFYLSFDTPIKAGKYTLSGCPQGGGWDTYLIALNYTSGDEAVGGIRDLGDGALQEFTEPTTCQFYILIFSGATVNNLTFKPQFEKGTATPYAPYLDDVSTVDVKKYGEDLSKEPTTYAVEADGTVKGVMSLYPSTTLITDNRAIIECEYNRDINKAFEELRQIIISLGGNI